ncbi:MAG: UDP-N-acetylmuramate dehydrogenase [Clostridiales bacterium]|jgi:UDP-N-acetylmuramate dehydrogenase|nr:UDP-N-acetylmuramate dehydrogenase [Clostridiales bacterium]
MHEAVLRSIDKIAGITGEDRVLRDEPMSRHTSFRIGGPAAALVLVSDERELAGVLRAVDEEGADHMLIGNGSNLLVSDEGYPGIVIKLAGEFEDISQDIEDPCRVRVGAAKLMSSTAAFLTSHGLSGFEFASGIPGSIGGAVFMNAGAYGGEMKDVVSSVRVMDVRPGSGEAYAAYELSGEEMDFSYRHSRAEDEGFLVLSAVLELTKDDPEAIQARVSELASKRNSKQPVNYPSAGSTFKRPVGGYAAALIEQSGLKGYRVGGAEVSEKHSGFVINTGGATAGDVLAVMRHVRDKVYEDSGITLEPEVRLINCSL